MPSCERCWLDSDGDSDLYRALVTSRNCTSKEQAGPDATDCPRCKCKTVHQYARVCMACGYDKATP